jgi:hypothetical protein
MLLSRRGKATLSMRILKFGKGAFKRTLQRWILELRVFENIVQQASEDHILTEPMLLQEPSDMHWMFDVRSQRTLAEQTSMSDAGKCQRVIESPRESW